MCSSDLSGIGVLLACAKSCELGPVEWASDMADSWGAGVASVAKVARPCKAGLLLSDRPDYLPQKVSWPLPKFLAPLQPAPLTTTSVEVNGPLELQCEPMPYTSLASEVQMQQLLETVCL